VLKLTIPSQASGPNIGTISVNGVNTAAPTGATQTAGNVTVAGFRPGIDDQIFGLDVVGAPSLVTLISDLQTVLQITNPGATVFSPSGAAGALFTANGDNVEIIFPAATAPNSNPDSLSWDLSGSANLFITQITVLPEPACLAAVGLAGFFLRRRRRIIRMIKN
jgi:hypothetical protein